MLRSIMKYLGCEVKPEPVTRYMGERLFLSTYEWPQAYLHRRRYRTKLCLALIRLTLPQRPARSCRHPPAVQTQKALHYGQNYPPKAI
jgi:hypothetical protein